MANRRSLWTALPAMLLALAPVGCDDDTEFVVPPPGTGGQGPDGGQQTTSFRVTIENTSDQSSLTTPFSPGVWAVSSGDNPILGTSRTERIAGLEQLAEQGDPTELAQQLQTQLGDETGVFDTPQGAQQPGMIEPGQSYQFEFTTTDQNQRLYLATMLAQSNDTFVSTEADGIELYQDGNPIQGDITDELELWNAGTEIDQAPGQGPDQAPRQSAPGRGAAEGVVRPFSDSTRALPIATQLVSVDVEDSAEGYQITVQNTSGQSRSLITPISPVFWAVHTRDFSLLEPNSPASAGLERLAEDGTPASLVQFTRSQPTIAQSGARDVTIERSAEAGPARPGERFQFTVPADPAAPMLSFATTILETNDVVAALRPPGVALFDDAGNRRPAEDVEDDIERSLALWDVGTEQNQVPGAGTNQPARQTAANQGMQDRNSDVRLYADASNDLAGPNAGGFASLTVRNADNPTTPAIEFEVTLQNTSANTPYTGQLSPAVLMLHNEQARAFRNGTRASDGLESLAEDGNPDPMVAELQQMRSVTVQALTTADGATEPGPLQPGQMYRTTIAVDPQRPFMNILSMVVPSNDTFVSLGEQGIRLLNDQGQPRPDAELNEELAQALGAWDAGTEQNQSGAAGPDQAPRQSAFNTGASEGDGELREYDNPVWRLPDLDDMLRVTIEPIQQ